VLRALLVLVLVLAACGSPADPIDAGASVDAGRSPDAGASADGGPVDGGPADAGADLVDAGGRLDAGPADAGACAYLDLTVFYGSCNGRTTLFRGWQDTSDLPERACPTYWTADGSPGRYADIDAALAGVMCSPDCTRFPTNSFTVLRCGVRTGYELYEDPEDDCDSVIRTPDGVFANVEAWDAAAPCPE
jgi:hypothetical protein